MTMTTEVGHGGEGGITTYSRPRRSHIAPTRPLSRVDPYLGTPLAAPVRAFTSVEEPGCGTRPTHRCTPQLLPGQLQGDDTARKGQVGRQKIFDGLLTRLDNQEASW